MAEKIIRNLPLFILLVVIFYLVAGPLRDFDIFFHIKSGEVIAHEGIIHHDVFSFVTSGREWFPYEWLFQIGAYYFQNVFGFEAFRYFTAMFVVVMIILLNIILRRFTEVNKWAALVLLGVFSALTANFWTARPHIVAYTFLLVNLALILNYFLKNKNWLWLSLPITLAWANLHGSIFLDIGFFAGYTVLSVVQWRLSKDRLWLKKAQILGLFTIITSLLSILPPLGFTQFRLLIMFAQKSQIIRNFVDEWVPLASSQFNFYLYIIVHIGVMVSAFLVVLKKKNWQKSVWLWPLVGLMFSPYLASRNVFLGNASALIIMAWVIGHIKKWNKWIACILFVMFTFFCGWWWWQIRASYQVNKRYFPVQAANFIIEHQLQGRMFNEYGYGGYLLYRLYPQQKVFVDGRTDLYLCCEIPELMDLTREKNAPDADYKIKLNKLWDKHQISFVLLRTEKHTEVRRIARILTDDPEWSLLFWDDYSQLFVRRDGKNDALIKQLGTTAATPYNQDPIRPGQEVLAMQEYQQMIAIADSARSENAIGYLMLKKGQISESKSLFVKAINLDPTFESPFMNMAEIAAHDGDYQKAIEYYQHAQKLAPDRGLVYLRIGQLYLQGFNDMQKARESWQFGVRQTVDTETRNKLQEMLNKSL